MSGNVKLALSHVVPDLVLKVLKGQDPLHILGDGHAGPALHVRRRPRPRDPDRDGVAGGDQRGLQPLDGAVDDRAGAGRGDLDQDPRTAEPFRYVSDPPFDHDVQLRVPDVRKARESWASRRRPRCPRCSTR